MCKLIPSARVKVWNLTPSWQDHAQHPKSPEDKEKVLVVQTGQCPVDSKWQARACIQSQEPNMCELIPSAWKKVWNNIANK